MDSKANLVAQADPRELRELHLALVETNGRLRMRDAANSLGVSEAELLAAYVGDWATPLGKDFEALLLRVGELGRVMALTRNAYCVHERKGEYRNLSFGNGIGLAVGDDIDLRFFMVQWKYGFAVRERKGGGVSRSLQFFDRHGVAVHKIHLLPDSRVDAFELLVRDFESTEHRMELEADSGGSEDRRRLPPGFDARAFRAEWDDLRDTHDFFPMLKRHSIHRLDAFEVAGTERAVRLPPLAYREAMESAREGGLPIMVFAGNAGCIQIHTGPIHALKEMGPWFNVLDPDFNLHVLETGIEQAWLVRKPTRDGTVTSIELFDHQGKPILMLFGARKPGKPENATWRGIAENVVNGVTA